MTTPYGPLDPMFLTTRETFPGEKSFGSLCHGFFGADPGRADTIAALHAMEGLLVHMANPEQIDDLFAHIDREKRVRYLSTSYLHKDIVTTVYAVGRGTGLLLDASKTGIEHISISDSDTVTDARGGLVASDSMAVGSIRELHDALAKDVRNDWSEVNVSFDGPSPILGFFALDGAMSKIYASVLYLKAGRRLPVFTYNREANRLTEFVPTKNGLERLIADVPVPVLRERISTLPSLFS